MLKIYIVAGSNLTWVKLIFLYFFAVFVPRNLSVLGLYVLNTLFSVFRIIIKKKIFWIHQPFIMEMLYACVQKRNKAISVGDIVQIIICLPSRTVTKSSLQLTLVGCAIQDFCY